MHTHSLLTEQKNHSPSKFICMFRRQQKMYVECTYNKMLREPISTIYGLHYLFGIYVCMCAVELDKSNSAAEFQRALHCRHECWNVAMSLTFFGYAPVQLNPCIRNQPHFSLSFASRHSMHTHAHTGHAIRLSVIPDDGGGINACCTFGVNPVFRQAKLSRCTVCAVKIAID